MTRAQTGPLLLDVARRVLGPGTPLAGSIGNAGWFAAENIPAKKLARARAAYADYDEGRETPVLLYDLTVFGSAKRGLLLTTRALYWSITSSEDGFSEVFGQTPLSAIHRLRLAGADVLVNEDAIGHIVSQEPRDEAVLQAFFRQAFGDGPAAPPSEAAHEGPGLAPVLGIGGPLGRATQDRPSPDEIFALIRGLKALHDEGALTAVEFQAKKQELLARL